MILLHGCFAAADKDMRNDADAAQDADGLLGGFCFEFTRRLDVGNEGEVDEDGIVFAEFVVELTDRLKEREGLDVADRSADFGDGDIHVFGVHRGDRSLDFVGDVRDDLHGSAEVSAFALAVNDGAVDASGGVIAGFRAGDSGKPFVMTEVEIGFRAVIGHIDFAVLIGRHRAGVDVEVRVEFLHGDPVSSAFEEHGD